jgi:hypothetical protein
MAAELTDAEVFGTAVPPPGALKKELSDADVFGAPPAPTPNDISGEGRDEYGRPLGPLGPAAPPEPGIIPEFLTRPPEPSPTLARTPEISLWPENAVEAYRATPPILTDRGHELVTRNQPPIGQELIDAALGTGGAGIGAFNAGTAALGTYIKETATKYGVPRLGEDINTYLQVAPLAHTALGNPRPPGPRVNPMLENNPRFVSERLAPDVSELDPRNAIDTLLRHDIAENPPPAPDRGAPNQSIDTRTAPLMEGFNQAEPAPAATQLPPSPVAPETVAAGGWRAVKPDEVFQPGRQFRMNQSTGASEVYEPPPAAAPPPAPAAEPPGPQSLGAAASRDMTDPAFLSAKTPAQALNDFVTSVQQTVRDRAQPGAKEGTIEDHNTYVPGVTRLESARVFDPEVAGNHDTMRDIDPSYRAAADKIEQDNHDILKDQYRRIEGDTNSIDELKRQRAEVSPDALKVFENERPVNAQPVVDAIREILDGPTGKVEAVTNTLRRIEKSLYDKDGNLEVSPSQLYGARRNLTTIRDSKALTQEASDAATARRELGQVQTVLDRVIGQGANGYSDVYLPQWAHFSRLIDQQSYLQSKTLGPGKITGPDGNLTANGMQRLLEQIADAKKKPENSRAKTLTPEQLDTMVAIRNELAAMQYRDKLAASNGSPTVKKAAAAARLGSPVLGHVRDLAVHGALLPFAGTHFGGANLAYQLAVKPYLNKRAELRGERKANTIMETTRNRLLNTNVPLE